MIIKNSLNLITSYTVNIQVQYLDGTIIVNNTVINQVVSTTTLLPFDKRSVGSPSEPQSSGLSPDDIIIECITTQRNHLPLWRTDSDFLSDENGTVTCDDGANRQVVTSNYTTEYVVLVSVCVGSLMIVKVWGYLCYTVHGMCISVSP